MAASKNSRISAAVHKLLKHKLVALALILMAGLFTAGRLVDLNQYLQRVQEWIWQFGSWGPMVFVAIYVVAMWVLLPGTPFTILAAFLFGNLWGFVTMMVAVTLAATTAFVVARYFARDKVTEMLSHVPTYDKLKAMVEDNHWFAIPFIRLMPIFPFAINNYAFGLTDVTFGRYLFYSEIVFIPMNAAMILGANALYAALTGGEMSWVILGGAVLASLVVLGAGYFGKRIFTQNEDNSNRENRQGTP